MRKYNFKFRYKDETRFLNLPIIATLEHKAIEEVKDFIEYEKELGKEIETGRLEKLTERVETVWIMEEEDE